MTNNAETQNSEKFEKPMPVSGAIFCFSVKSGICRERRQRHTQISVNLKKLLCFYNQDYS